MAELQKATPVGVTGYMRRSWKMTVSGDPNSGNMIEVTISNPAQYIGVVELGRRASPVSKEGVKSLQLWVKRKLGVTDEAKSLGVAYAIAKYKKKHDTPGQEFVQKTVDRVVPRVVKEIIEPAVDSAIENR